MLGMRQLQECCFWLGAAECKWLPGYEGAKTLDLFTYFFVHVAEVQHRSFDIFCNRFKVNRMNSHVFRKGLLNAVLHYN